MPTEKMHRLNRYNPALLARAMPFFAYMAVLAITDGIGRFGFAGVDLRWLYAVKIAVVVSLLLYFKNQYQELTFPGAITLRHWVWSIAVGSAVFVAWINLDAAWMVLGSSAGFNPTAAGGGINLALVLTRLLGATLVVPVMEELFWRSLVLRWIDQADFMHADPARCSRLAFSVVVVLFGFEHNLWFAGMVAAVAYNFLYMQTRNLWLPVVAHAVTNGLLGLWVLYADHWEFW
jgi:CAAX prenyl protease-like protein